MSAAAEIGGRRSRSRQDGTQLRAPGVPAGTIERVDVSGLSTTLNGASRANVPSARVQVEASTAVLDLALEAASQQATALLGSLSFDEPAGLTFSPQGLSPGRSSRFVADL